MISVNDIVKIVTNLNSNVSTNVFTTDLTTHINQTNVRHDSQDMKRIKSDNINKICTNYKKFVRTPLKIKKVSNLETQQKRKLTRQKILCNNERCGYLITEEILTVNKNKKAAPHWELDVLSKMPKQKAVPCSILKK